MKKTIVLSAAAAAMGLFAMNASALPEGFESVNFHATLNVQISEGKTKNVSVGNKDLLSLVADEFTSTTIPSGSQLVSYGLDDEEFAVLDKHNNFVLEDASTDGDSYEFFINPFTDQDFSTESIQGSSQDTFTAPESTLTYVSGDGNTFFTLTGIMTIKDSATGNDNESYSMQNASGHFELNTTGEGFGTITGGVSGSGKDVDQYRFF